MYALIFTELDQSTDKFGGCLEMIEVGSSLKVQGVSGTEPSEVTVTLLAVGNYQEMQQLFEEMQRTLPKRGKGGWGWEYIYMDVWQYLRPR